MPIRLIPFLGCVVTALATLVPAADTPAAPAPANATAAATATNIGTNGSLISFAGYDVSSMNTATTSATLAGTADVPALRVTTKANTFWPGVRIPAPGGDWDLSAFEYISMDVRNVDKHDMDVFLRVDNPGADGSKNCIVERIGILPDQRVTLNLVIKRATTSTIKLFGMIGYPIGLGAIGQGSIDPAKVVQLVIFTSGGPADSTFEVSNLRAYGDYHQPPWATMGEKDFFPFIDKYGQFRHKDWPGKIHSDADLLADKAAEATALSATGAAAAPTDWDQWGGWTKGPSLAASGHFRTQKVDGKWWLVDPDGHVFFSVGPTCVGFGGGSAAYHQREAWFDIPADDPLTRYVSGKDDHRTINHAMANLERKYGPDWKTIYPGIIHERLRAWGLNTIGNWSDPSVCALKKTPYTRTFWYQTPMLKDGKVNFPDMLDLQFAAAVKQGAERFLSGTAEDPWCIGYFLDNEMPWGGEDSLARYALASSAKMVAKQKLQAWLQDRYHDISALNTAWGTTFATWDAFTADTKAKPGAGAGKDLVDFTGVMAEAYFATIHDVLRAYAPHQLYLGCRCVGGSTNVIAAAVKHCDVISFNRYCASVRDISLPDGFDAPQIVSEFHFGGIDRGPFWGGLFSADNQDERARKLTSFITSGLDNPQIVGVHWFQYADEPTTGRDGDGENGQIGFVDVCDTPYQETVKAARASADGMYARRAGNAGK